MGHICKVNITLVTSVNDGPPSNPLKLRDLMDGAVLTIVQPVDITFDYTRDKHIYLPQRPVLVSREDEEDCTCR